MKINRLLHSIICSMICCFMFTSCYDGVTDVLAPGLVVENATDSLSSVDFAKGMLITAQDRLIERKPHQYQYQFNLHIDNYAGYLCLPHNFDGRVNSTFSINDDFSSGPGGSFSMLAQQVVPVMASASRLKIKEIGAMASILFSCGAHQYANVQGPFPYFDYKVLKKEPPLTYVPLNIIYDSIFVDIEQAVTVLKAYKPTPDMDKLIAESDKIAGGKVANWIKFANSLRLRMAMDIVKVDKEKAKRIAEAAVQSGVLEKGDADIAMDLFNVSGETHPLAFISQSWVDTRLNASFENILKRTGSPLLEHYFNKNHGELRDKTGRKALDLEEAYIGIRSGTWMRPQVYGQDYILFSRTATGTAKMPLSIFKVAEVCFLRAEGALRGWSMGGTAQSFYEDGIYESLKKNGLESEYLSYINRYKPEDIDYVDYYDKDNNTKGLIMIGNNWGEHDMNPKPSNISDDEYHLEKIITQKWIALFPMSVVAWTDQRRTGYPRLLPPAELSETDGDGSIDVKIGIRRMPYTVGEDDRTKVDILKTGIPALGEGKVDEQGTRLWWDLDIPNF